MGNTIGTSRVFLSCTTTAPKTTCQMSTGDPLNSNTLNFSDRATGIALIAVNTTSGGGTAPGSYSITVNAYTVSGSGTTPDATVDIPLTVK